MKNFFSIIILCICCLTGCKQELKSTNIVESKQPLVSNSKEEGVLMLNKFYSLFYFDDNVKIDQTKIKLFISETLLNKIDSLRNDGNNIVLDYDPFIKGQDYNGESIKKTLEIIPLKNKNQFRASFILFGNKNEKRTNVDYLLIKNKQEKLVIGSIINDKYLNIVDLSHTSILDKKLIDVENKDLQIENKWIGVYKGSFLQFKEEYNDPRSWATVYIYVSKDSLSYELHSLKEENSKLELIDKAANFLIFKMENGNTLKISNINNDGRYALEGSQMVKLIKDKSSLDLTKE
ncbi:hypothetical protein L1276_000620 [Flavobacterium sp. HSC-32F16]|uniref:hypothetical protein n=1 Tax=Flavobacterium sp. HSC-32F16 TaxID=2910964 RepID=UPI0020A3B268|nr:hypothetical protein [Flavobacterium sp. HSC-32F16]MCP2025480.1 hypothetical protein [Flavobacterium sp. HSC-32F16]